LYGSANGIRESPKANEIREQLFKLEVRKKKIEILWFNHCSPIDTGLPYILNIFDLQHRLQPWFPEVSADGIWRHREEHLADGIRRAAIVTVGSQEAKEQLSHFYGVALDNVYVLPFPTPKPAIEAGQQQGGVGGSEIRAKYGIQGDFLFYPAQFWPHKNHVNLLRAVRVVREQHGIPISLVLSGADQGNLSYVRKVTSDLGLDGAVNFLGFIPYADVIALYRSATALSYVSFFGPENLPPLEALALGCPVLLADIPGVRTLFGDAPIFVDPRSEHSIARGVQALYDDPESAKQRADLGRKLALQNTVDRYIHGLQAILDKFEPMRRCWP
jgi:glycosyltransferase involved in cell wall biosynthesis